MSGIIIIFFWDVCLTNWVSGPSPSSVISNFSVCHYSAFLVEKTNGISRKAAVAAAAVAESCLFVFEWWARPRLKLEATMKMSWILVTMRSSKGKDLTWRMFLTGKPRFQITLPVRMDGWMDRLFGWLVGLFGWECVAGKQSKETPKEIGKLFEKDLLSLVYMRKKSSSKITFIRSMAQSVIFSLQCTVAEEVFISCQLHRKRYFIN